MTDKLFGLGVFVCIFNEDLSKILLVKRNEEKRKKWNADWGNVGGMIEFGETSIEGCIREAKEEIGIDLDKEKIKLIEVLENPAFTPTVHGIHFVYATTLNENTKIIINEEADEYKWFKIEEMPDRMIDKKEYILEIYNKAKEKLK